MYEGHDEDRQGAAERALPRYSHSGPSGDIAADLHAPEVASLTAVKTKAVGTGLDFEFPPEFGALGQERSGLALTGIWTPASPVRPTLTIARS